MKRFLIINGNYVTIIEVANFQEAKEVAVSFCDFSKQTTVNQIESKIVIPSKEYANVKIQYVSESATNIFYLTVDKNQYYFDNSTGEHIFELL